MATDVVIGVSTGRVSFRGKASCALPYPGNDIGAASREAVGPSLPPGVCQSIGTTPKAFSGFLGESSNKLFEIDFRELAAAVASLQTQVETLSRQNTELRRQTWLLFAWHDTVNSPWYRRLIWWFMGYRMSALGTWYTAPWNRVAAYKYNHLRTKS